MKKNMAFTLAEVLITLGIIGVVTAMTLPALVKNYQDKANIELLKKFYTVFSQGLQRASIGEGCEGDIVCYFETIEVTDDNPNPEDRAKRGLDSITKYIPYLKKCTNPAPNINGYTFWQCIADYKYNNNFRGTGVDDYMRYNIVMKDGMYVTYVMHGIPTNYGWVLVDVNGPKKPNREGRDIFTFWLYDASSKKILPPVDQNNCTDDNMDRQSNSCAERVIKNGWKIDY